MDMKLLSMIMKPNNSKGYTMIESVIVLMILCMCMLISIPNVYNSSLFKIESWLKSEVVCLMKDSYLHNTRNVLEVYDGSIQGKHIRYGRFDGNDLTITPFMTITKPLTIRAYNEHREIVMKIWLGMGKVYGQR